MVIYTIAIILATILATLIILVIIASIKKYNEEKRRQERFKKEVDRLSNSIRQAYEASKINNKEERKNE